MESGIHSGLEIARSAIVLRGIRLPVVVDYRSLAAQVGYGSATLYERARLAGVVLIPTVERDHGVHDHKGPQLARFHPRDYPRVIRLWRLLRAPSAPVPQQPLVKDAEASEPFHDSRDRVFTIKYQDRRAGCADLCRPRQEPIITLDAPAASASATSRGWRMPPSAQTCAPSFRACAAHSRTALNWGRPTPVIIRVVHIAPGPTPTFTMSAPAATRSATPAAVTTFPAATGTSGLTPRTARSALIMFSWWPCAVSTTRTSTPASSSSLALAATSPLMPRAAPMRSRPRASVAGSYRVARSAPVRVRMPTQRPSASTTGASRCRPSCSRVNARCGSVPAGRVSSSVDITSRSWVNRSTPVQSDSVTTPTGRPSSTTITPPCARLGSRPSAWPVVSPGASVIGVSCTRLRLFTQEIGRAHV